MFIHEFNETFKCVLKHYFIQYIVNLCSVHQQKFFYKFQSNTNEIQKEKTMLLTFLEILKMQKKLSKNISPQLFLRVHYYLFTLINIFFKNKWYVSNQQNNNIRQSKQQFRIQPKLLLGKTFELNNVLLSSSGIIKCIQNTEITSVIHVYSRLAQQQDIIYQVYA